MRQAIIRQAIEAILLTIDFFFWLGVAFWSCLLIIIGQWNLLIVLLWAAYTIATYILGGLLFLAVILLAKRHGVALRFSSKPCLYCWIIRRL